MAAKPPPVAHYPPYDQDEFHGDQATNAVMYLRHKLNTIPEALDEVCELAAGHKNSAASAVKKEVLLWAPHQGGYSATQALCLWKKLNSTAKDEIMDEFGSWLLVEGPPSRHALAHKFVRADSEWRRD